MIEEWQVCMWSVYKSKFLVVEKKIFSLLNFFNNKAINVDGHDRLTNQINLKKFIPVPSVK